MPYTTSELIAGSLKNLFAIMSNGVASALVTQDGTPVPEAQGAVRAQAPLRFPTATVKAATVLPDLDKYTGPLLEYGRMEATASDPAVQQQFGMIVGLPNGGQVNALATLNIRGANQAKGSFPPVRKYPTVFHAAVGVSSTPSARVRRATIAVWAEDVAPRARGAWGDRRSGIHAASTESEPPGVRQNAWGKTRRREYL